MTTTPEAPADNRPRPLAADTAPCRTCGVAVPLALGTPTEHLDLIPAAHRYPDGSAPTNARVIRQEFTRCSDCARHRALAAAIVDAHPALAARLGGLVAVDQMESALVALAVLGRPHPDPATLTPVELGRMLRFLTPEGAGVSWMARADVAPGYALPVPFAHVEPADRTRLTVAWGALLSDRRHADAPPVRLAPPALTRADLPSGVTPVNGGCLLCGVGAVEMSSQAVSRAGGRAAAAADVWTLRPVCDTRALGGRGPQRLRGYTCPACTEAVNRAGALGPSAVDRAVVEVLGLGLHWGDDRAMGRVPGWGALVSVALRRGHPTPAPNGTPWAHLGDLDSLRDGLAQELGLS